MLVDFCLQASTHAWKSWRSSYWKIKCFFNLETTMRCPCLSYHSSQWFIRLNICFQSFHCYQHAWVVRNNCYWHQHPLLSVYPHLFSCIRRISGRMTYFMTFNCFEIQNILWFLHYFVILAKYLWFNLNLCLLDCLTIFG